MTTPFNFSASGSAQSTLGTGDFFGGTINGPGASSSTGSGGLGDILKQVVIGVVVALVIGAVIKRMK